MKTPEYQNTPESPFGTLEQFIADPVPFLRKQKEQGMSCNELMNHIDMIRAPYQEMLSALKKKGSNTEQGLVLSYIHEACTIDDRLPERYVPIFLLLRDTGFTENEIQSALMDRAMLVRISGMSVNESIKKYIEITETALHKVFGPETLKEERKKSLVYIAQYTVEAVKSYKERGKNCSECLNLLIDSRSELGILLKQDPTYAINKPNALFVQYYKTPNSAIGHYVALVKLLNESGFTREEIGMAFTNVIIEADGTQGESRALFLSLTTQATAIVFGEMNSD